MLITFKSKAAAEVVMYAEHAKPLLDLINKDTKMGVITAAEAAAVAAKLEAVVQESKAHPTSEDVARDIVSHHGNGKDDNDHDSAQFVSFATRAYPLLEMIRAAARGGNDILWGV